MLTEIIALVIVKSRLEVAGRQLEFSYHIVSLTLNRARRCCSNVPANRLLPQASLVEGESSMLRLPARRVAAPRSRLRLAPAGAA